MEMTKALKIKALTKALTQSESAETSSGIGVKIVIWFDRNHICTRIRMYIQIARRIRNLHVFNARAQLWNRILMKLVPPYYAYVADVL